MVLGRFSSLLTLVSTPQDRLKHHKNSLTGYLTINSLRNKITDPRVIIKILFLDNVIFIETKIDESLPTAQFMLKVMKSELGAIEINTVGV